MRNKLATVIIENPRQIGWGYRIRDTLITLATLTLWALLLTRLYAFFTEEGAFLEQIYSLVMLRVVIVGFIVTFLIFHCWAIYNRHIYTRNLKWQHPDIEHSFEQNTVQTLEEAVH
ncbi:hypothetical protein [Billgrantia montanilacus]|uniref:Uncharacterized protein n=1 Tax=Billgrantia montanilacus TaxID=2282305 RepID=A0A368U0R0_9GAMM|nr:hypothetical protein [Halomonas montanilacus]RCV90608.1 hypothetical protein DU505_06670 [Halomonas montanilacus]